MSFTDFNHYKHDITGKFRDITSAVSLLDESSFKNPENLEVLHAVHEVLLRMVMTSRKTLEQLGIKIELIVSHKRPQEWPLLPVEGVQIRLENTSSGLRYWLYTCENPGELHLHLEKARALLPVTTVRNENALSQK